MTPQFRNRVLNWTPELLRLTEAYNTEVSAKMSEEATKTSNADPALVEAIIAMGFSAKLAKNAASITVYYECQV